MSRARYSIVAALGVAAAGASWTSAEDWNQWRGPQRSGTAPYSPSLRDTLPEEGLRPLWVSEDTIPGGGNGGWASPIVADGRVYQFVHWFEPRPNVTLPTEEFPPLSDERKGEMSQEEIGAYEAKRQAEQRERREKSQRFLETVFCHDAQSGELLWKNERDSVPTGFSQSCTPVIADGRLYWHGADRKVVCVDATSGSELWTTPLPVDPSDQNIPSSPAVADGVVVALVGRMFGINAASGELLWEGDAHATAGTESSPVVYEHDGRELVVANVRGNQTVCFDPKTGELVWSVESEATRSTPVVVGDKLVTFGHSRKAGLRCFDLNSNPPELLWTFRGAADPGSSPVVVGGHVYVQGEDRLACVDLATGQAAWQTRLELARPQYTSPVAADGKVFYACEGVLAFIATPDEFQPLYTAKIDEAGRLAPVEYFRTALNLEELESTAEGQQKAQQVWQEKIGRHGPLECASPAIADGKLYVRLKSKLACYDLANTN